MAKNNISSDMLEAILTKVTDKFASTVQALINQFTVTLTELVNGKLLDLTTQMSHMESKIAETHQLGLKCAGCRASITDAPAPAHVPSGHNQDTMAAVEVASRALIEFDREKEEINSRSRNVIITGLPPDLAVSDRDIFDNFCEEHLTVKPQTIRVKRLGKDDGNKKSKLCVTLTSKEAVDDLLDSAGLLRKSSDSSVRKTVFFNRDLTRQQANAAYKARCTKRSQLLAKAAQDNANNTSSSQLDPNAQPFRTE